MIPIPRHGRAPTGGAPEYLKDGAFLRHIATPANLGAWYALRSEGNVVYTELVTAWTDASAACRHIGHVLNNVSPHGPDVLCSLTIEGNDGECAEPITLERLIAAQIIESAGGFASRGSR